MGCLKKPKVQKRYLWGLFTREVEAPHDYRPIGVTRTYYSTLWDVTVRCTCCGARDVWNDCNDNELIRYGVDIDALYLAYDAEKPSNRYDKLVYVDSEVFGNEN